MSLVCVHEQWRAASDPLYVFLPFVLAVCLTAAILAMQLLIGFSARHDQGPQQHQTFSKGANR